MDRPKRQTGLGALRAECLNVLDIEDQFDGRLAISLRFRCGMQHYVGSASQVACLLFKGVVITPLSLGKDRI
jgi:hypothetical protein